MFKLNILTITLFSQCQLAFCIGNQDARQLDFNSITLRTVNATVCADNRSFKFIKNDKKKSCYWIGRKERRRVKTCKNEATVVENCPITCGVCCENDPSFTFFNNIGEERNCEWITEKERRKKVCNKKRVKIACAKVCDYCKDKITEVPSSAPSLSFKPSVTPKSATTFPSAMPTSNGPPLDPHGIQMIYASQDDQNPQSFTEDDWVSKWETYTQDVSLTSAFDVDPNDARAVLRGNGDVEIPGDGNGELLAEISPRLYITAGSSGQGWENVEFTAYGKYLGDSGSNPSSTSGLTLVARTSHSTNRQVACDQAIYAGKTCSPCNAAGYYAKIYRAPGSSDEVSFQKEYYHEQENSGSNTIYSATRRVTYFPNGALPLDTWVGMKFVVYTIPNTSEVKLELYYDSTDGSDGGDWVLIHEMIDSQGKWKASGGKEVPAECTEVTNGSPVLGPRDDCFLRTDSSYVLWKKASVRRIDTVLL